MKTLISNSKQLLLSIRPHLWPSYLVLAGFCLKLIVLPSIPTVYAESSFGSDYRLLAVEAFQAPNNLAAPMNTENSGLFLANGFMQINQMPIAGVKTQKTALSQKAKSVASILSRVVVTAYSSTPDQTDDTPFISANGTYVYDGMLACNFLPFGAKVRFPEIYGDKVFTVEDRMALRNSDKMDIWMKDRQSALQFGVKKLAYEVVR